MARVIEVKWRNMEERKGTHSSDELFFSTSRTAGKCKFVHCYPVG